MGMMCNLLAVSPAQMRALHATPSLVKDLVSVAQSDSRDASFTEMMSRLPPDRRQAAEERKAALMQQPAFKAANAEADAARTRLAAFLPTERPLDLDKSWHILHYVLTGRTGFEGADGPGEALLGGENIGPDLFGYGPARVLDVEATETYATFLQAQNESVLHSRINHGEMMRLQIYGVPWGAGNVPDFEAQMHEIDIGTYFPKLRDYVIATAAKRNGLLVWIS